MQLFATPSSIPWTKTLVLCWVRYTIKLMPQLCIHTVFSYRAIHFITYAAHELYFNWLLHMLWQSFQIMWRSGFVCSKDFNVSGVLQLSSAAHGKIDSCFIIGHLWLLTSFILGARVWPESVNLLSRAYALTVTVQLKLYQWSTQAMHAWSLEVCNSKLPLS